MVEPRVLDDFKSEDWIGVHYLKREDGNPLYNFPTIIHSLSNRNKNPDDDYVQVLLTPQECPSRLLRKDISRIWRIGEVNT
jgi:hypothetical protein